MIPRIIQKSNETSTYQPEKKPPNTFWITISKSVNIIELYIVFLYKYLHFYMISIVVKMESLIKLVGEPCDDYLKW